MASKPVIPKSPSEEAYRADEDQGEVFTKEDPIALLEEWLAFAAKKEPNDPNAMALATVDAAGQPDVRMVLLKDLDARGLAFYTNTESAKGRDLAANPRAAVCFHWKTIRRQARVQGPVERVGDAEADAYFATRARSARIGAWASAQSRPLEGRFALEREAAAWAAKFGLGEVPRPPFWSGYRIAPLRMEFWVNRPFRLHDRLEFRRDTPSAPWRSRRLFP
jgi:pyridoxamine 5'-phosphate oxidase